MNSASEVLIIETLTETAEVLELLKKLLDVQAKEIQELRTTVLLLDDKLACKLMHWREL